jgi:Ca2+-binding RTX toxin-like protein
MPGILNTEGATISATVAAFEDYDTIRHSAALPTAAVALTITDAGTLDISDELGAVAAFVITSNAGNAVTLGAGNDTLYGGSGDDTLGGGTGNDEIADYTGSNSILGGSGNDTITYGSADGSIDGGADRDVLIVAAADVSALTISNVEVLVTNGSSIMATVGQLEGFETITVGDGPIYDSALITLRIFGAGAVDLVGEAGLRAVNLTTSVLGNTVTLGDNADSIYGGTGNDSILAGGGADLISDTAGTNRMDGGSGDDTLNGGSGNDTLIGGAGTDSLRGGAGNDTYLSSDGDIIIEEAIGGTDTLLSAATVTALAANVENLVLTGTLAISGTGNSGANRITGNGAANRLSGGDGNDTLVGGVGLDTLIGGMGNDVYIGVDADTITEGTLGGTDTLQSAITVRALATNVEYLVLTGTAAISGTGNSAANRITGNSAANTLNGAAGTDTLIGGRGNDVYVTSGGDRIIEGVAAGTDILRSSVTITALAANVENLVLTGTLAINGTGNAAANRITGNSAANTLKGAAGADSLTAGAGNDTLNGGTGNDRLTGGIGSDRFVFSTALGTTNVDRMTDYNVAADTVALENAIFTGLVAGTLTASAFRTNTTGLAGDASDRIIYDSDSGALFFDANGSAAGGGIRFATLATGLALTSADFLII